MSITVPLWVFVGIVMRFPSGMEPSIPARFCQEDELMKRAKDLAESEDVGSRRDLARDLLHAGHYDLALEHYLWLWPATRHVPNYGPARLSFMLAEMVNLAALYPPAKAAFLEILDGLQAQIDAEGVPEFHTWQEWTSFCEEFNEQQRIVAWYEKRCDAEGRLFAERFEDYMVQNITEEVLDVLFEMNRLPDVVRLMGDPKSYATRVVASFEEHRAKGVGLDEELRASFGHIERRNLTDALSRAYAALLSVGRKEEAIEVGELLIRTFDSSETRFALVHNGVRGYEALLSANRGDEALEVGGLLIRILDTAETRLALVNAALKVAHGPDESLDRWLDEAEAAGADVEPLRRWLERLTAKAGASGD